jgi:hypothetical protein
MTRSCNAPRGLEEAAVAKYYRDSGGTTLRVWHLDTAARIILLGNVRGELITYRWTERTDCNGFRLVAVERGAR